MRYQLVGIMDLPTLGKPERSHYHNTITRAITLILRGIESI